MTPAGLAPMSGGQAGEGLAENMNVRAHFEERWVA